MVHQLFLYVSLSFLSPTLTTKQPNRGSQLLFKNRTRYYGGISEWPVKIKGVPRSFFGCCQLFIGACYLMWFVQTGLDLKSNTSRHDSGRNDWKGAWKSRAHSGSQSTPSVHYRSTSQCRKRTTKVPMLLTVHVEFKCHPKLLADGSFTTNLRFR